MLRLRSTVAGLRALFRKQEAEQEMDEELRGYLDAAVKEKMRSGLSYEQALRAARVEMGSMDAVKEEIRTAGWESTLETLWQDLRYGFRVLRKNPGFTAVAVITLALGIGANTAIFSVVYAVLLRPLPYEEPGRLVMVWTTEGDSTGTFPASGPDYLDWKSQNHVFEGLAAGTEAAGNLTGAGEPLHLQGFEASRDIFEVLGVQPLIGRGFLPGEDQAGRNHVVVLSYGLWQRGFGGDPTLLGKTITLDGEAHTVVGIMPASFQFPNIWGWNAEFWKPLSFMKPEWRHFRGAHFAWTIGRLKPGVELSAARTEMEIISRRLAQQYPASNQGIGVRLVRLHDYVVREVRSQLLLLLAAVGFILLIACANLANLLLAQGGRRWREIAVRLAVGASRGRLIRQLLAESALLSLLGGVAGMLLAVAMKDLLLTVAPADYFPGITPVVVDTRALGFNLSVSLLTAFLFGLAPALVASRVDVNQGLKDNARAPSISQGRLRSSLIVGEVAASLVLLVGAGLTIRSLIRLLGVDAGFNPHNVLTLQVALPESRYSDAQHITRFYSGVLERLRALPGVDSAGTTSELPIEGGSNSTVAIEGQPLPSSDNEGPLVETCIVTPGYFRALRIPLLRGRDFDERDTTGKQLVAVINEAMARRFWPNQDPIGKRFSWDKNPPIWIEVVGVVGDARVFSLDSPPIPEAYSPLSAQFPFNSMVIALRTGKDPLPYSAAITRTIHDIDKDLPVSQVRTMQQIVRRGAATQRLIAFLLGLLAALALVMAAVGIYGVISNAVSQRTHEIGIRMALGAGREDVLRWVLIQGMRLALLGIGIGLVAALAVTRLMRNLLYEIHPNDPATLVTVSVLLAAVAVIAIFIPARRATKVDPTVALRYE
jgi:putative ABC transport system permease protein